jgi:hypothetical protein
MTPDSQIILTVLTIYVYFYNYCKSLYDSIVTTSLHITKKTKKKPKLRGFGRRAIYTDRATAACCRS